MGSPDDILLTKRGEPTSPRRRAGTSTPGRPLSLLQKASRRLQAVSFSVVVLIATGWLAGNWIEGELAAEFQTPLQWASPMKILVASLITFGLARSTAIATIVAHINSPAEPPSAHTDLPIPAGLDTLILACLAKDRADRPATAEDSLCRLDGIELDTPWTRAPRRRVVAAALTWGPARSDRARGSQSLVPKRLW